MWGGSGGGRAWPSSSTYVRPSKCLAIIDTGHASTTPSAACTGGGGVSEHSISHSCASREITPGLDRPWSGSVCPLLTVFTRFPAWPRRARSFLGPPFLHISLETRLALARSRSPLARILSILLFFSRSASIRPASPSRSKRNVTAAVHSSSSGRGRARQLAVARHAAFFAAHRQGGCRRDQRGCRSVAHGRLALRRSTAGCLLFDRRRPNI